MKFLLIDPAARVTLIEDHPALDTALKSAGLKPGEVDFGSLSRGLDVVVYEYVLFRDPAKAAFFSIGGALYEGAAVIHAYNPMGGNTVSVPDDIERRLAIKFLSAKEVEREIAAGLIRRPQSSVNGEVFWQWPEPAPAGFPETARAMRSA